MIHHTVEECQSGPAAQQGAESRVPRGLTARSWEPDEEHNAFSGPGPSLLMTSSPNGGPSGGRCRSLTCFSSPIFQHVVWDSRAVAGAAGRSQNISESDRSPQSGDTQSGLRQNTRRRVREGQNVRPRVNFLFPPSCFSACVGRVTAAARTAASCHESVYL